MLGMMNPRCYQLAAMILTIADAKSFLTNPAEHPLYRVTDIHFSAATILAQHRGPIRLPRLRQLTTNVATQLKRHFGTLELDGLEELSSGAARHMAQHRDHLNLSGLKRIDEDTAKALSRYDGWLVLDGLEVIDSNVATQLAKHEGNLSLLGLTDVPSNVQRALAQHRGFIHLHDDVASMIEECNKDEERELDSEIAQETTNSTARPATAITSASQWPLLMQDLDILEWLSSPVIEGTFTLPKDVTIIGQDPLNNNDLIAYLESQGCDCWVNGCTWIIVGRDGFTLDELDDLIEEQWENEPKILSQELLFAAVISGQDPFTADEEILLKFAEGHPALEHLLHGGLLWPEVIEMEPLGEPQHGQTNADRVEHSPLNMMNYRVGRTNGLYPNQRHNILKEAFETDNLPPVSTTAYMEEWGQARSRKRLWRIAHHLAWLAKFQQNNPNMEYAIADWVSDLEWLKRTYYRRSMSFRWPY
jgi:hypothetical protein